MRNPSDEVPRLAPPGAGIPAIERFIGGIIFGIRRWRGTPDRFKAEFERERGVIARLYRAQDERTLSQRVIIRRVRGLEDSSRFWSVWMTLDHLRIVNDQIVRVIDALTHDIIPDGKASTATVKPSPSVGPDVAGAYETSCDGLVSLGGSRNDFRTRLRYAHPWFGLLDAAGWYAMAATHMGIHRVQIERILHGQTERGV